MSFLQTLPQLLARRGVIGRDCLGPALAARKASEADVFGQESQDLLVMFFFALPVEQELKDAVSWQSMVAEMVFD